MNARLDTSLSEHLAALNGAQPSSKAPGFVSSGKARNFASVMQDFTPNKTPEKTSSLPQPTANAPKIDFSAKTDAAPNTPNAESDMANRQEAEVSNAPEEVNLDAEGNVIDAGIVEVDAIATIVTSSQPEAVLIEEKASIESEAKKNEEIAAESAYEEKQESEAPQAIHIEAK